MIKQGETIIFKGRFQEKVDGVFTDINTLNTYTIKAVIQNPLNNKNIFYTYSTNNENNNITIESDNTYYSFSVKGEDTADLVGECSYEIALIDSKNNAVISKNSSNFIVEESYLGRLINKD